MLNKIIKNKLTFIIILVSLIVMYILYINITNREGKIIISSNSIVELRSEAPYLSFDKVRATQCNWYQQIRQKSGIFLISTELCYDGKVVLDDNYYQSIISKYKWEKYNYPNVPIEDTNADIYGPREMYQTSMIKNNLRTQTLYICKDDDWFFNSSISFSFLDKENKTLYFYYYQI